MEIWLPLSEGFNKNILLLKSQIGRAINLNHIRQEKAEF